MRRVCSLLFTLLSAAFVAQCQAARDPVNGTLDQSVSLPLEITLGSKIDEVEWKRISPDTKIARFSNKDVKYFGTEEYKKRIKLHPGNFSLQISDLQREDTGFYEVVVTTDSGDESSEKVQLDVYEPVSGTQISIQHNTENCNITVLTCSVKKGDHTRFRWWREGEELGNDSTHHLSKNREVLKLYFSAEANNSVFECEARNPVSEDTAQIRLRDVCNETVPSFTLLVILLIGIIILLCPCLFIFLWKAGAARKKKFSIAEASKKRQETQESTDGLRTVYAEVQPMKKRQEERPPPEGNEMVTRQDESVDLPLTVYDTIKNPGVPLPEPLANERD